MRKVTATVLLATWCAVLLSCGQPAQKEVVVYTSLDQVFSEPVLMAFEGQTGIRVKAVYDVEASKTTGLVNRLLAEKDRPKCDVFWNSEVGRTILLKKQGALAPYRSPAAQDIPPLFKDGEGYWTGFAARARVLIYNTTLLKQDELPASIFELTDTKWKGKVAIAYPLFGTTATHVAALYTSLGRQRAEDYLQALQANEVVIVNGNSVARDMVVEGRVPLAFTDTDDVNVAMQSGKPVGMIFPDSEGMGTLLIPNTVAVIQGAPHPDEAKALVDYLLSREVESRLAYSESAQIPVRPGVMRPPQAPDISTLTLMQGDFEKVAENMDEAARFCRDLFTR